MFADKHLQRSLALVLSLLLAAGPGYGRTRRGEKLLKDGGVAEARQEWDKALDLYEQALRTDPSDSAYLAAVRRTRFQAGQYHVDLGQKLRSQGNLDQALAEFQKAFAIDPSSTIAEQELRRTYQMIEREKKKAGDPNAAADPATRGLTPQQLAKQELEDRMERMEGLPELKPTVRNFPNLRMSNQPVRVLYDTIGKLAGLNVVVDPDPQPPLTGKNYSVDLSNTTLEQALDYVAVLTKTYWKPLSSNTIFITNDNLAKRRDFEEQLVKVFYLQNVGSPQDLSEIVTAIRTIVEVRKMYPINSQNAIVVRAEADKMALVEKIVNDIDKPKSEVVVDVVVMEANRARTREITASIMDGANAGLRLGASFTPRNQSLFGGLINTGAGAGRINTPISGTTGTVTNANTGLNLGTTTTGAIGGVGAVGGAAVANPISLSQIGRISTNDYSVNLPGALFALVSQDRQTRVLQSPQVRAISGTKASLRIGDKIPYATGSFSLGLGGGVGGFPAANTQFQFAEVGVNVDVTPTIHNQDEVTLKIELEISNVRDRVDIGGLSQPVIGQRKITHEVRIREGQVSLLAGLSQEQNSTSLSGIPGLINVPILRNVFGSNNTEKNRGELLVALIPHIVRTADITPANLRSASSGNETTVKVTFAPKAEATGTTPPASPGQAGPQTPGAPGAAPGVIPVPVGPAGGPAGPGTPQNQGVPGVPVPPGTTPATTPPAGAPAATTPQPGQPGFTPAPVAPPGTNPVAAVPLTSGPGNGPIPAPADATAGKGEARAAAAASGSGPVRLAFQPGQVMTQVGSAMTITLNVDNASDLFSAPLRLRFDPKVVRLADIVPGAFLSSDGQRVNFAKSILNDNGEASIVFNRLPGANGANGGGALISLTLQAVGRGTTAVTVLDPSLRNSQMQPVPAAPANLVVIVQ